MVERSDSVFFREIDPDLCQNAYAFQESGFTSSVSFVYGEHLHHSTLRSAKLQMFDDQSCHV